MHRFFTLVTSKTVWGAVAVAGGYLASQPKIGWLQILQAAGGVLSAAGVRDAITKATAPE